MAMEMTHLTIDRPQAGCTPRVQRLRERVLNTEPSICAERGLLVTEAYERYAADPPVLRRARAFAYTLDNMTITIDDGELLVGNQASVPRGAPLFPEYLVDFLADEIDEFPRRPADRFQVSGEVRSLVLERIVPAWRGKTLNDRVNAVMPAEVAAAQKIGAISGRGNITSGDGHIILDIPKVLRLGLEGVIAEARGALAMLSTNDAASFKRRPFLEGVVISLKAVIRFAQRFADEAEQQAARAGASPERSAELLRIADTCRRVPGQPARTFVEAVQAAYFVHLCSQIESNGHSFSLGRLDQYLFPFYVADLAGDPGAALAEALLHHQDPPVGPHPFRHRVHDLPERDHRRADN
jgi:pyruvate-formate lyase